MNVFVSKAIDLSIKKSNNCSDDDIISAESKLSTWKNNPNKHEVDSFYQDAVFCILYVQNLYACRVKSFYEVLKNIYRNDDTKYIMENVDKIVSIGCGPGPEIAAFIDFVRGVCSNRRRLDILAVDAVDHWADFIRNSVNCDNNISIHFQNAFVNSAYLARTSLSGVCLMSYPEAINFDRNFWNHLKLKFNLIILTDQSKYSLLQNLSYCGYTIESMEFKGSKKYAFYITPENVDSRSVTKIVIPDLYNEIDDDEEEEEEIEYDTKVGFNNTPKKVDSRSATKIVIPDLYNEIDVDDEKIDSDSKGGFFQSIGKYCTIL